MNTCVEPVDPAEVGPECPPAIAQLALAERGISTMGQLRRIPKPVLMNVFGEATGRELWQAARRLDAKKAARSKLNFVWSLSASRSARAFRAGWVKRLVLPVQAGLEALDRVLERILAISTEEVPRRTTPTP